jgi:HD-GYP domain-containing protein (c-di-GMP phosphodiesterase class II)
MVLGRPVYDNRGHMVFDANTKLSEDSLKTLGVYGVGEVLIDDPRVTDVEVQPLIPSELEAQAAQALRQIMTESQAGKAVEPMLLEEAKQPVFSMTRTLFPEVIGEPNAAGCSSLQDYNYLQPAKVAGLSLLMGRRLDYAMLNLAPLGVAALLMNIGYAAIPHIAQQPGILDKPGQLTEPELAVLRQHTESGAEILRQTEKFGPDVVDAVLQHHERWDGSGYPKWLKKGDISTFARIIAICDTYYALVSRRPHRRAYLPHEAVEFIMAFAGDLFDPELVQIFSKEVPLYPTGVTVRMNTGEVGIISDAHLGFVGRPMVRIIYDEDADPVKNPYDIDLRTREHQQKLVVEVLAY